MKGLLGKKGKKKFAGRKYAFCSEDCKKEFDKRPEDCVETAA